MKVLLGSATRYKQIATTVAEIVAHLLRAKVFVLDQNACVIASSDPEFINSSFQHIRKKIITGHCLRVPLLFNTQLGEAIVCKSDNGEEISFRLIQEIIKLVINQTAMIDTLVNQHQLKDKFIYELLHGLIDENTVVRYSNLLGIDLTPPRAVILINPTNFINKNDVMHQFKQENLELEIREWSDLVIPSIVKFFHLPNDTICAYIGNGEIAVLKASDTKNLGSWANLGDVPDQCSSSWSNLTALKRAAKALLQFLQDETGLTSNIGVGRYHPGIGGLAQSYQDARAALSLGYRFCSHNQVHCLDELGIAAFIGIGDEQTKIELAAYLLSPLNHEPELLATLDAFFAENCCSSSTAHQLSIHRNTLSYRLDKINLLTGLDPRNFDDAVQIRLALLLRKLSLSG
jgi:carbohydrate diacid regulator